MLLWRNYLKILHLNFLACKHNTIFPLLVYFVSGSTLYALNIENGKLIKTFGKNGKVDFYDGTIETPVPYKWIQHNEPGFGPQGPYYCGVGGGVSFGRKIVDTHLQLCLQAGFNLKL